MNRTIRAPRAARRRALRLAALCTVALPWAATAGPTIEFGQGSTLNFTYGLQVWNEHRSFTSSTNPSSSSDTFLRRNRLALTGQYNDMIGFYAQLEAGGDGRGGDNDRSVYWRDAYVTFDYSDALRFIVGRVKNTFSRENLEACLEPLTLDRAEVLSYTPFAGTRDMGAVVWGNLMDAKLQYRLMVADGREGQYVPKGKPRVTARVHVSLWDPEFSYGYLGTYLGTQKVLTIGASYDTQSDVAYGNYLSRSDIKDYKARTIDAFMELPTSSGVYTASAAVFDYDTGGAFGQSPDPALSVNSDLKGHYLKAGYMLPNKLGPGRLQLFARHEKLDYGVKTGNAEYFDNTWNGVGFNYYIDGQRVKITGEFNRIKFDTQHPVDNALRDYRQATLALQLIF
ncbi:selenite/tellurite reduction operon porin ExtI [Azohydromonas sp.]|uniref:selenite/tellurite reduction operon porin ExtI n=1 Tax=Azohydromonas sp. TaxID=1872666 RepID=UPI002C73561F|nr:selenite/tellurite reduction operon porin ExtI [Azohydromonas sp.]HMM86593.1 selenite/tellurite reduction operon porin ExtI [Azohydromonas sp.]